MSVSHLFYKTDREQRFEFFRCLTNLEKTGDPRLLEPLLPLQLVEDERGALQCVQETKGFLWWRTTASRLSPPAHELIGLHLDRLSESADCYCDADKVLWADAPGGRGTAISKDPVWRSALWEAGDIPAEFGVGEGYGVLSSAQAASLSILARSLAESVEGARLKAVLGELSTLCLEGAEHECIVVCSS